MRKETTINLISKLLEMASDEFVNHGCSDLGDDFWKDISEEEKQLLYKKWHDWNGDPEDYNPDNIGYLGDSHLMSFFSDIIKKELEK